MMTHEEAVRETQAAIERFKTEKGRAPNMFELAHLLPGDISDASAMKIMAEGMEQAKG